MEIERGLLEMFRDPALDVKPKLLEQRGGAFYSEAAAMLVESLHGDRGDVQVVNVRNSGAIPNLADDAVVEVACRIGAGGADPLPVDPLAPEMLGLVEQVKAYERLTVAAAVSGDRDLALKALMANPLVADYRHSLARYSTPCSKPIASTSRPSSPPDRPAGPRRGTGYPNPVRNRVPHPVRRAHTPGLAATSVPTVRPVNRVWYRVSNTAIVALPQRNRHVCRPPDRIPP